MKKNKKKKDEEYKYLGFDIIAFVVTFLLGIFLLMIGVEDAISLALVFSFSIIMIKAGSNFIFKGFLRIIINTIYFMFFVMMVIGLFIWIFNIVPNKDKYEYDKVIFENDSIGYVTNVNIDTNGDVSIIKLIKPTMFKCDENVENDVIYKKDNNRTMYLLYDTNIGLHIIYVGYSYMYTYSFILFFIDIGKFILLIIFELVDNKRKTKK